MADGAIFDPDRLRHLEPSLCLVDDFLRSLRAASDIEELRVLVRDVTQFMGFRHFALITHEDLRTPSQGSVDLRDYPVRTAIRIIDEGRFRRDPVIRACIFADGAFLWSQLADIIAMDRNDRIALELGLRDGLNEGITVPCARHGQVLGSCTFAGLKSVRRAELLLGPVQMIGVFAFQQARKLSGQSPVKGALPRLEPRMRDCIVLAGRGLGDKVIAHRLGLTHRTVESYFRDARRTFSVRDRTELLAAALMAGEIGLDELRPRQGP